MKGSLFGLGLITVGCALIYFYGVEAFSYAYDALQGDAIVYIIIASSVIILSTVYGVVRYLRIYNTAYLYFFVSDHEEINQFIDNLIFARTTRDNYYRAKAIELNYHDELEMMRHYYKSSTNRGEEALQLYKEQIEAALLEKIEMRKEIDGYRLANVIAEKELQA